MAKNGIIVEWADWEEGGNDWWKRQRECEEEKKGRKARWGAGAVAIGGDREEIAGRKGAVSVRSEGEEGDEHARTRW